jgi:uncharacterized membrane protein YfcA
VLLAHTDLWLIGAGFSAGVVNALAGGGTFFSFPVFMALGLPPVVANSTNAAAVWPAHPLAAWSERAQLRGVPHLPLLIGLTVLGALVGAGLLSTVGNHVFKQLVPYLLMVATALFAFGSHIRRYISADSGFRVSVLGGALMLLIAAYGGFFSAGMGVMLMAGLLLLGLHQMHTNNAVKNLLGALVNTLAVALWTWQGLIDWSMVPVAFVGAVAGGLLGARLSRWLPVHWLRRVVIGVGFGLSVFYLYQ